MVVRSGKIKTEDCWNVLRKCSNQHSSYLLICGTLAINRFRRRTFTGWRFGSRTIAWRRFRSRTFTRRFRTLAKFRHALAWFRFRAYARYRFTNARHRIANARWRLAYARRACLQNSLGSNFSTILWASKSL